MWEYEIPKQLSPPRRVRDWQWMTRLPGPVPDPLERVDWLAMRSDCWCPNRLRMWLGLAPTPQTVLLSRGVFTVDGGHTFFTNTWKALDYDFMGSFWFGMLLLRWSAVPVALNGQRGCVSLALAARCRRNGFTFDSKGLFTRSGGKSGTGGWLCHVWFLLCCLLLPLCVILPAVEF